MLPFRKFKLGSFTKIKKDFFGYIFYKYYEFSIFINMVFPTYFSRFILRLNKVELGEGCQFIGIPIFVRFPLSRIKVGSNCTFRSDKISNLIGINHRCLISTDGDNTAEIIIGNNCGFSGVSIRAKQKIYIGNNVLLGPNVIISDSDGHNLDPAERFLPCKSSNPVIIKDNVFIGVNAIVWKGVTIGENSVIGANSLVTRDIPANVIAAGNPCRVLKKI